MDYSKARPRRRATGIKRAIYYAGKVVGSEQVYDSALLMFLMRAHRPHLYRENVKVEHSGGMEVTGDRKVTFEFVRPAEQQARTLAESRSRGAARPHTGGAHSRGSRGRSKGGTMIMQCAHG